MDSLDDMKLKTQTKKTVSFSWPSLSYENTLPWTGTKVTEDSHLHNRFCNSRNLPRKSIVLMDSALVPLSGRRCAGVEAKSSLMRLYHALHQTTNVSDIFPT